MDDRRTAVRFWEAGRVAFNVAITVVWFAIFLTAGAVPAAIGDLPQLSDLQIVEIFLAWSLCANFLYSFVYAVEFFLWSSDPGSRWIRYGRASLLAIGIVISIFVAGYSGLVVARVLYTPPADGGKQFPERTSGVDPAAAHMKR